MNHEKHKERIEPARNTRKDLLYKEETSAAW